MEREVQSHQLHKFIAYCTACQGMASSLPTECPGKPMTYAQQDTVTSGSADFREGRWQLKMKLEDGSFEWR